MATKKTKPFSRTLTITPKAKTIKIKSKTKAGLFKQLRKQLSKFKNYDSINLVARAYTLKVSRE